MSVKRPSTARLFMRDYFLTIRNNWSSAIQIKNMDKFFISKMIDVFYHQIKIICLFLSIRPRWFFEIDTIISKMIDVFYHQIKIICLFLSTSASIFWNWYVYRLRRFFEIDIIYLPVLVFCFVFFLFFYFFGFNFYASARTLSEDDIKPTYI